MRFVVFLKIGTNVSAEGVACMAMCYYTSNSLRVSNVMVFKLQRVDINNSNYLKNC